MSAGDLKDIFVEPDIDLKRQLHLSSLERQLIKLLDAIPDIKKKGVTDISILRLICEFVETYSKKKYQVDKKELVLRVCEHYFGLDLDSCILLGNNIETLIRNKLIKKFPFSKIAKRLVIKFLKKTIGI